MSEQVQTTAQETPKAEVTTNTTEAAKVETTEAKSTEVSTEVKTETTEAKTEAAKPVVPEKYELKMPEGSQLSQTRIDQVSAYAKEKGLSNEQAQEILNRESDAVAGFFESQKADLLAKSEGWISEIKADKEFGGENFNQTIEFAKRSIDQFGDPELKRVFDETGIGNHPLIVKMHAKIGKLMADDKMVSAHAGGSEERREDRLYPTMKKK